MTAAPYLGKGFDCGVGKDNRCCDQGYSAAFGTVPFIFPFRACDSQKSDRWAQGGVDYAPEHQNPLSLVAVVAIDDQGYLRFRLATKQNC